MVIPLTIAQEVKSPFADEELKRYEQRTREQVAGFLKEGVTAVSIAINNRCNLECEHCYIFEPERRTGQPSEHFRALSPGSFNRKTARKIALDARARTPLLTLPSMEPFLTEESRASSLAAAEAFVPDEDIVSGKARSVAIITNGTLMHKLTDYQVAELAKRVEFLSISLEGGKQIHDQIRGIGSFERTFEGIRDVVSRGYDPRKICLQSTIQPSISKAYEQAREILDATAQTGTGKASLTAFIEPRLTFAPEREDVEYHEQVFREVLRACSDAQRDGVRDKLITIYGTYESPAAVVALNNIIKAAGVRAGDLKFNAFETAYYRVYPGFDGLEVRLEVAPHPVEIPGYPRILAYESSERINLTDADYPQGAMITSCFAHQIDKRPVGPWAPGLIPYLDREMQTRGAELAYTLPIPRRTDDLSVDPNVPRTKTEYFGKILETAVRIQLGRTLEVNATLEKLRGRKQ